MDTRLVGLTVIHSPCQLLSVVFIWVVFPYLLKLLGYSWPVEHLTLNVPYLALLYIFVAIFTLLISRYGIRLGSLPILLRRVGVCCAYLLAGFPVDLVALMGELVTYVFLQLMLFVHYLATPFVFLHDLFHVELAPEEVEAFANAFCPAAFRRHQRILF